MVPTHQDQFRNRLINSFAPDVFDLIRPHLRWKTVERGTVLIEPNVPITELYFPESGLASFVNPTDVETEIGVVGREGFVGACVMLHVDRMPLKAGGQIAGEGCTISSSILAGIADGSSSLRVLLGRYTHVFMMQVASTTYANAHYTVEQRLARWLLMTHDRLDGDELPLTHEFLSIMLGVRRPGVTVATHMLEGVHAIRARRGRITIRDRDKLRDMAGDSYGLAEAEYENVLAPRSSRADLRHELS